jgi:hypothetical protein
MEDRLLRGFPRRRNLRICAQRAVVSLIFWKMTRDLRLWRSSLLCAMCWWESLINRRFCGGSCGETLLDF